MDIIKERFAHISNKEFMLQMQNASTALNLASSEPINISGFLDSTDIDDTSVYLNKSTYNLFMTLLTSGGGYSKNDDDVFTSDQPNLIEGLEKTISEGHYHGEEAQYLLDRINELSA